MGHSLQAEGRRGLEHRPLRQLNQALVRQVAVSCWVFLKFEEMMNSQVISCLWKNRNKSKGQNVLAIPEWKSLVTNQNYNTLTAGINCNELLWSTVIAIPFLPCLWWRQWSFYFSCIKILCMRVLLFIYFYELWPLILCISISQLLCLPKMAFLAFPASLKIVLDAVINAFWSIWAGHGCACSCQSHPSLLSTFPFHDIYLFAWRSFSRRLLRYLYYSLTVLPKHG